MTIKKPRFANRTELPLHLYLQAKRGGMEREIRINIETSIDSLRCFDGWNCFERSGSI